MNLKCDSAAIIVNLLHQFKSFWPISLDFRLRLIYWKSLFYSIIAWFRIAVLNSSTDAGCLRDKMGAVFKWCPYLKIVFSGPAENIQTAFLTALSMPEKLTEENCHVWQFLKRFVIYVILGRVQDKRKSRVPFILSIKSGEMCSS